MRFAVIGAGGWGTAIARLLAIGGHETVLWARDAKLVEAIARDRRNTKYLPDVELPIERLRATADFSEAVEREVLVLAVPSFGMSDLLKRVVSLAPPSPIVINLAKGIDRASKRTMSELIGHVLPAANVFTLSGPSHAEEVGKDVPTAVVLAGVDLELGSRLQREIASPRFRVYLSEDIRGVELCATVKNIIALATGISDGLGYGDNSRAALITRGLAEIMRLGIQLGGDAETFMGLAGMGDLVLTCTDDQSRNRRFGIALAQGMTQEQAVASIGQVVEGIKTTEEVHRLATRMHIDMPITHQVYQVLYNNADPHQAVHELFAREQKPEFQH